MSTFMRAKMQVMEVRRFPQTDTIKLTAVARSSARGGGFLRFIGLAEPEAPRAHRAPSSPQGPG
jgi:hypothetical protein